MKHLMRISEIKHVRDGEVIWEQHNVPNVIHLRGELFCLSALFNTQSTTIPTFYYAGLDNRTTPATSDTFSNLSQEPSQNGYGRQPISSATGFSLALNNSGVYQATSVILTFVADGGSWGPIKNVFLGTTSDNSGVLISTAELDGSHTVSDGDQLTIRVALSLQDFV